MLRCLAARSASWLHALRELCQNFLGGDGPGTRALRLLRGWLTPEQRAQLEADGYFDVTGSHTGRRYRIYYRASTNVYELDAGGMPILGWCFGPDPKLPVGDVMLAQKIALEVQEFTTLALANNFTTSRWPPRTEYPFEDN
jgi:hypothetical protein